MSEIKPETHEFKDCLKKFSAATWSVNRSYSYAAGYYESLLASMFDLLTKKQRDIILREMREVAIKHETLARLV